MDNLLEDIASCGVFQVAVMVVIRLQAVSSAWSNVMMMYGGYNPGWTCWQTATTELSLDLTREDPRSENESSTLFRNSTSMFLSALGSTETFHRRINLSSLANATDGRPLTHHDNTASCDNASFCHSIEFDDSANTIVTHFSLICDRKEAVRLIILLTMAGTMIGCMFGGQFGEKFGRKTACFASTFIIFVTNLIAIFSPSLEFYAIISLFSGVGSGGIFVAYIVYGYEFLNPKWRGIVSGIPSWNLSVALFGVVVSLVKDWRYVHLATCCLSGFSFLAVFWAPESIRWLRAHGKEERLKATLTQIIKVNNRQDDVNGILQKLRSEKSPPNRMSYSYFDLFRSRSIRVISAKCTIVIPLLAMSYFTFAFSVKNLSGDIFTNILLAGVIEIPFTLCTIPLMNTLGRRKTIVIFMSGAALCSLLIIVCLLLAGDSSAGSDVIKYSSLAAKGFLIASWTSVVTLTQELFPTVIRNVGHGYLMVVSRLGSMVSPYMIPDADERAAYLATYVCLTVAFGVTIFIVTTLPETNKMPLEDWIDQKETASGENETQA